MVPETLRDHSLRESKTHGDRRAFCHLHRGDRASARAMVLFAKLKTAGVRNDVQAGQPKTVRPTLAFADFGSKPGPVVINACLRTEGLERSAIPHQTELAMAVSAVVLHSYPPYGIG